VARSQPLPDVRRTWRSSSAPARSRSSSQVQRAAPRRSNFQKYWRQGLATAGITNIHFHDLRHTGNTLAAQAGATMSDLMARMGHASTRAAQIYLHTSSQRDRVVADALNSLLTAGVYLANGVSGGFHQ
jgi:integrase